ncbi:hypothetical protein VIBNISOn1_890017 [Vibrio nigripulchritudo SOn1]|uniref:Transposase n=1 Tax=Vibrio nigripulchritudo SOn1 TaxID=1238450 RepID=A0AAV2VYP1_9VIBR|nr:hypothetical protein VIBNISOn1_890017 [Vibrio nigripulchritudo SOn1]
MKCHKNVGLARKPGLKPSQLYLLLETNLNFVETNSVTTK